MVSDVFGAKTLKFIRDITQAIEGLLAAFISNALEAIELGSKSINSSFFLS
jgi:hypothetical protein